MWNRCEMGLFPEDNFVCLGFSTVLWRVRNRWPHFAAVYMRWTPVIRAHLLRTPPGLSWPPWDSSRMRTSCARWSASSWRRSAPTWKYVLFSCPPSCRACLPPAKGRDAVCLSCLSLTTKPNHGNEEHLGLLWHLAFILNVWIFCTLRKHANSYTSP